MAMDLVGIAGIVQGVLVVYLMWRQNGCLEEANRIAQAKTKVPAPPTSRWVSARRRYWPMMAMGFLAVLSWIPLIFYLAKPHQENAQPREVPEFDAQSGGVVNSYGLDSPNSCFAEVNGALLMSRESGYKLAIACFIYDGSRDILDAPYLQVSYPYDIRKGQVAMRVVFQSYFNDYRNSMHATGINIAILNVPKGIDPSKFATLRQARDAGAKIPALVIARSVHFGS